MASKGRALAVGMGMATALACGGGGGGDGIQITWEPNPLTASFAQGQNGVSVLVVATLSSLPKGDVFIGLADDGGGFADTSVDASQIGPTSFQSYLHPRCTLAPGTHSGNLTLRLCADQACAREYGHSVLPYTFTVGDPALAVTVKVDGVVKSVAFTCYSDPKLQVPSGHALTFESSVPVTWNPNYGYTLGDFLPSNIQTTATSWSATFTATANGGGPMPPGVVAGAVMMQASAIPTSAGSVPTVFVSAEVVGAP